ncbi:hypothetical protein BpHYR1_031898 [Brachionus plicatilis]|uniref:Uncharacterized protein n=1 Tax=Brachionus plicatilis TaxID=10195 RepID=A0A3M7R9J4_BRAPC|nr:hypothetical protein BpHYR1_031898 [Brachionus plicatilis]
MNPTCSKASDCERTDFFKSSTYSTLVLAWFMTFSATTVLFFSEVSLLQGSIKIELLTYQLTAAIISGLISGWYSVRLYEEKDFSLYQSFCGISFSLLVCGFTNYCLILYVGWLRFMVKTVLSI